MIEKSIFGLGSTQRKEEIAGLCAKLLPQSPVLFPTGNSPPFFIKKYKLDMPNILLFFVKKRGFKSKNRSLTRDFNISQSSSIQRKMKFGIIFII